MATTYDEYPRVVTGDLGGGAGYTSGAAPAGGGQIAPMYTVRQAFTAGVGTAVDTQITIGVKCRLLWAQAVVVTGVASSVVQVFTAAAGGGTACTSSISTASAGVVNDARLTISQVFAAGSILYIRQSGGATLFGGEVMLYLCPEQ